MILRVAFAIIAFLIASPVHAALNDIEDYPHKSSVELLESRGIINGYDDGSFRPYKSINRAEFLKLLMLAVYGDQAYQGGSSRCFTDFYGNYQWYWPFACTAKTLGVIHGHPDGTFRGTDTIILAEALKMALEAWEVPLEKDVAGRPWYERYMNSAAARGIFKRFPNTPDYLMTRGEMALLVTMIGEPIAVVSGDIPEEDSTLVEVSFPPVTNAICGNGIREGNEQCDDGNTQNGDGCSEICVVVAEPIHHGALRIEQQPISSSAQASGNKDVPLFAFTALAGRQDVYITTIKLKSTAGSLAFAENFRLFIDMDNNGVVETLFGRATADGQTITFADQNILVKDGYYTRVELWGDIDTSMTPGSIAIGFDTTQPDFIEGVDRIDGEDVTGIKLNDSLCTLESICWISVFTNNDQTVEVRTKGNLYVTEDSTPISSRQLLASTESNSVLRLKFRSDSENIIVKELAIDGVPSSVDALNLYLPGASTPLAVARAINCDTQVAERFCTATDFTIPQDGDKSVLVKAVVKSDEQGATSGDSMILSLTATTTGNVAVQAEGYYSGQRLLQNDGNSTAEGEIFIGTQSAGANSTVEGPGHTVALAKIVSITNTNPDPEHTSVPTGPAAIARFAFTAADHSNTKNGANNASINKLKFTVSAVNLVFDSGSFRLYNAQNSSVVANCTASNTTGTITVTCDNLVSSAVATNISRGATVDLVLQGTVSDSQAQQGSSILQVSLNSLSNPGVTGTVEWTDGETTFGWVDIGTTQVKSTTYRTN